MKALAKIVLPTILIFLPSLVVADYIDPGTVDIKTKRYTPEQTAFDRGTYTYDVSWQGIPVATATVAVGNAESEPEPHYQVTARAKTAKVIDLLYRLRFVSESVFDVDSFSPLRFYSHQKENSRDRYRAVSFVDEGLIRTTYKKNGKLKDQNEFRTDNMTLDPISAAFVARSLPLRVGLVRSFDVYNGKHRYLITFKVLARETIKVAGKDRDSFRVTPHVKKLTDTKGENRLKQATLWISAGEDREVLKLESKVLVGRVNAKLVSFAPASGGANAPTVVASRRAQKKQ